MDSPSAFSSALTLVITADPAFVGIVGLSLLVTGSAVLLAAVIGLPLGCWLALARFRGRSAVIIVVTALMGLPPVVAGLALFVLLSRSGPLGALGLLFTPGAMIAAQTVLVLPIVIALTRQIVEDLHQEYRDYLASLDLTGWRAMPTLLWDARFALTTALLAGFGRASAEVGAVLIVGGNIAGHTRTMTTAIALETAKGELALALGLGLVLITLTLGVTAVTYGLSRIGARMAGGR